MELYGSYTSPFVRHCRVILKETELSCDFIETPAAGAANQSPTKKVPYLRDATLKLTDSSSITRHLREKSGGAFLPSVQDFDLFCMANTLLDAGINAFLFQRFDGLMPADSKYLTRQVQRVTAGLEELDAHSLPAAAPFGDAHIRLACFLDWGLFRERFTLGEYPNLREFLAVANSWAPFAETAPPEGA